MRTHFFIRFFLALIIGMAGTLWYLQTNERFITIAQVELHKMFKRDLQADFSGKVTHINFFTLTLHVHNVTVKPLDSTQKWRWSAHKMHIHLSWLSLLLTGQFGLYIFLDTFFGYSSFDFGKLPLYEHARLFFEGAPLSVPISLESLYAQKAEFLCQDAERMQFSTTLDMHAYRIKEGIRSRFTFLDAQLLCYGKPVISQLQSTVRADFTGEYGAYKPQGICSGSLSVPLLEKEDQLVSFNGQWRGKKITGSVRNTTETIVGAVESVFYNGLAYSSLNISVACKVLAQLYGIDADIVGGVCKASCTGVYNNFIGNIECKDLSYKNYTGKKFTSSLLFDGQKIHGLGYFFDEHCTVAGPWEYDTDTSSFWSFFSNYTSVTLWNNWHIPVDGAACSILYDPKNKFFGKYYAVGTHKKLEESIKLAGTITNQENSFTVAGTCNEYNYKALFENDWPYVPLEMFCKNADDVTLCNYYVDSEKKERSFFSCSCLLLQKLLERFYGYTFSGKGGVVTTLEKVDDTYVIHLNSDDLAVKLPETYNVLHTLVAQATVTPWPLRVTFDTATIGLQKGSIDFKKGHFSFSPIGTLETVVVPFSCNSCFVNWKDTCFGVISAQGVVKKEKEKALRFTGDCSIEKGKFKENPFSQTGQKEFTHFLLPSSVRNEYNIECDLHISTKEPVYIQTPYLVSRAAVDLQCSHTKGATRTAGRVEFMGGTINFPYKQLHIARGHLHFLPYQPYDPLIELYAQGTFKKYGINLIVGGSLDAPHVVLESNPPLKEEQIVSLLFSGTVEENLNLVVPTLLMQNVDRLLFGNVRLKTTGAHTWLDRLKHIRIVPRFADQTGRGGVRGALEIEVNDRLHASIEKNFSLSEDTRVEVEYIISDDMSIKGTKDERSDLGAQLEMRFNF